MRRAVVLSLAALLLVFTGNASAQTETGQISGTVLEEQGHAIPNAKIAVRNLGTDALRETNSDDQGAFIVTNLLPATYAMLVEAQAFTKLEQQVQLAPGGRISLDLKLRVGKVTETIEASATAVAVNTQNQTVGQLITAKDTVDLPLLTRNNFTAEYGRASAGVVNVTTKSGTNDFHGTAYEFGRYAALAANTFDNNARGIAKPGFTRNQFGYSVGGPVEKDKLFFFQSTEWLRVRSSSTAVVDVPNAAVYRCRKLEHSGIFLKIRSSAH